MPNQALIDRWIELFPALGNLNPEHLATAREAVRFADLASGAVAYHQGWECPNYVMCVDDTTRVFKSSGLGREILIYRVGAGETRVRVTTAGGFASKASSGISNVCCRALPPRAAPPNWPGWTSRLNSSTAVRAFSMRQT